MIDYNAILQRAVSFFPRWMDIRKRYKTSIGGNLMATVIDETKDIEQALIEYKKSYFLDTYTNEGHEDKVVAFAFKANIGTFENSSLLKIHTTYNDKQITFPIAKTIEEFLAEDNRTYCHYEEGYVYLKTETVEEYSLKEINYSYQDYDSSAILNKTHIWNIFDEFACFVNIQRQTNETNSQLVKRILYHNKNLPNGTEQGLKHAIISELLTIDENITVNDIDISTLTPDNLRKPYKEFNTLLDKLAMINRDTYKNKIWDIDDWQNDFKTLEYIDHLWDTSITKYVDGIGSGDDLKVILADAATTTDVELEMYKKSEEKLNAYVHNKEIPKKVKLNFKRYNNILNSVNLRYKIQASEAIDITNDAIELTACDESHKIEKRRIQDIYKLGSNIATIDNSKISDNYAYRLEFVPSSEDYNIAINKAKVIYKNTKTGKIEKTTNLIKQAPGFMLNAEGALVSTSTKKSISNISHFNSSKNFKDTFNGISLVENTTEGQGTADVSNFALSYITFSGGCDYSPIPKAIIDLNQHAFWDEDTIVFRNDTVGVKGFNFDVKANEVKFDVLDECVLQMFVRTDDSYDIVEFIGPGTFSSKQYQAPVNMSIKVECVSNSKVKINNFIYNAYEINYKLSKGSLITLADGQMVLPSFSDNTLFVTMKSYSSKQPFIKGIYIGSDFSKISYKTDVIKPLNGCDRIIEIDATGSTNLHKTDDFGNSLAVTKDYIPATSYKALSDGAFVRFKLDEYSSIERITSEIGRVETIDVDGLMLYQVVLKAGQVLSDVTISGFRTVPVKVFSLIDMIKVYIKDFNELTDKIYANKITGGLVVIKNGADAYSTVVKLKSDMFTGVTAQRYMFTKLPLNLEPCFIVDSNTKNFNKEHFGAFNSIDIYPKKSDTYIANNSYSMMIPEASNIKIVNNFSPELPTDNPMMIYTVEPLSGSVSFKVRFHSWNETIDFTKLKTWSIGEKNIAIKADIDLNNSNNFDIDVREIELDTVLKQHITLEESYPDNQGGAVIPSKFILTPPEHSEVLYQTYSGVQEADNNLIKYEEFIIESDGFNKLDYSNINRILYFSFNPYEGTNGIFINDYTLLKKEGIIVWNNKNYINSAKKVYIRYAIDKPLAIKFDLDYIYKEIGYNVDAYKHLDSVKLKQLLDGQKLDLKQIPSYNETDLVFAKCNTPGFESSIAGDKLEVRKMAVQNSILVKTGYYYKNGREFYMFTETDRFKIKEMQHVDYHDVDKSGGELTFVKRTNNFVMNSEMRLKGLGEVCNIDHNYTDVDGVSNANSLTACANFNDWNNFNTRLKLVDSLNGVGIQFNQLNKHGYSFIEITDKLEDGINNLSLYADNDLKIFLGTEAHTYGINFARNLDIKIAMEILSINKEKLRHATIDKQDNVKYFLVIQGNGELDDIILSTNEINDEFHIKNINKLSLKVNENTKNGYRYKMFIRDNKGISNNGASVDSYGNIVNTSKLDWGVTAIKTYTVKQDFLECETTNVSVDTGYIQTTTKPGTLITNPIFIDNPNTVKRLFYKINNVDFDDMKDFKITILTGATPDSDFIPVSHHNLNVGYSYGDYLSRYIKVMIDIPKNKVIDELTIFAEYKSTKDDAPKAYTLSNGYLESKVYDTQYSAKYRLKSINIKDVSNINNVDIKIRAAKDKYSSDVWMPWKTVNINQDLNLEGANLVFEDCRFFQIKVALKEKNAFVNIENIELEVI